MKSGPIEVDRDSALKQKIDVTQIRLIFAKVVKKAETLTKTCPKVIAPENEAITSLGRDLLNRPCPLEVKNLEQLAII